MSFIRSPAYRSSLALFTLALSSTSFSHTYGAGSVRARSCSINAAIDTSVQR